MQVVVMGGEFDLSVTAFSVSDTSVFRGDPITFTTTVGNASSATTPSGTPFLRYHYWTDATSDTPIQFTGDTPIRFGEELRIAPGETVTATFISASRTRRLGTYYYGACVTTPPDSDTSNNCSAGGVRVDVVEPDFDLSVTTFSVSESSIVAGEAITLNATVTNDSSATTSSRVATLRYYRSPNATITSADTEVGTADSIIALAASATETETATDSPSTAGTYYYGACVVVAGDSDTRNDCSAGVRVDVVQDFDLSVTAFSVEDASAARVGSRIRFNATVGNDSSATVSSPDRSVLSFYRSSDATISSSDIAFDRNFCRRIGGGGN